MMLNEYPFIFSLSLYSIFISGRVSHTRKRVFPMDAFIEFIFAPPIKLTLRSSFPKVLKTGTELTQISELSSALRTNTTMFPLLFLSEKQSNNRSSLFDAAMKKLSFGTVFERYSLQFSSNTK